MVPGCSSRAAAAVLLLLAGAWSCQLASAEPAAREPPLARVGTIAIDPTALAARAARLTPAQRLQIGKDWPAQRRHLLADELVPEALMHLEAEREDRGILSARDRALAGALSVELERAALARGLSKEQPAGRLAEQQSAPRTLLIWRILLRNEADASALLQELGKPSEGTWTRLARERSLDRATHMRSGSLGYVAPSGQTHMPQVRVSPALFAAAEQVADGELVPRPVPEGSDFAVVWRRASLVTAPAAPPRSASEPGGTDLGAQLVGEAVAREARTLTRALRAAWLRDYRPELVAGLELRSGADLEPAKPGGTAPTALRPVTLLPRPTDSGLR